MAWNTQITNVGIATTGNAGNGVLADVGSAVTVSGKGRISLTVKNTSDTTMTDFAVLVQAHAAADWVKVVSGTDWATATAVLRFSGLSATAKTVSGLLTTEVVTLILDLGAPYSVQFQAGNAAGASKTMTIYGSAMR